ncbi:MAG: YvcK family protein [Bacillati bacterium ANGP1]|uniref:Putative gluconeogenesis factor n=1 Tax=Candidatus Segetimicrobium genomatis TaxID=2569760 RepID=A0A537JEQ5_9BACT|nr:MAG: YvcK family protein [Terrabacteria group bacterium ANGP1]
MSLNGRRNGQVLERVRLWLRWLEPGLGVKRWIALMAGGIFLLSIGVVLIVNFKLPEMLARAEIGAIEMVYIVTGHAISPIVIGVVLFLVGTGIIVYGMRETVGAIVGVFLPRGDPRLVEMILTGLSTLLRGLKKVSTNLTAVVTVFDDGGSSGRLRREQGVLPPGDIRNCLVALAEAEPLLTRLFTHRFKGGELDGHSFGNLFIASMSQVTGDLETALKECSKVLAIRGRVLPTTLRDVTLCAEMSDGTVVEGESSITRAGKTIRRVFLKPDRVPPLRDALEAIAEADLVILGPGSLYTSVVPNLLVYGVVKALRRSHALKVYVCNVMTQHGETRGFRASDHARVLLQQGGRGLFDYVLVNTRRPRNQELLARYAREGGEPVEPDIDAIRALGVRPVAEDVISEEELVRHDPRKIATVLLQLLATVSPEAPRAASPL